MQCRVRSAESRVRRGGEQCREAETREAESRDQRKAERQRPETRERQRGREQREEKGREAEREELEEGWSPVAHSGFHCEIILWILVSSRAKNWCWISPVFSKLERPSLCGQLLIVHISSLLNMSLYLSKNASSHKRV